MGDGYSIAWRVLDAQYWGVPQRRRRIYLVADFAGGRAGKILFEREGVRGNSAQSKETREKATADARGSADGGHRSGGLNPLNDQPIIAFMAGQGSKARSIAAMDNGSPTLKGCPSGLNQVPSVVYPATPRCYVSTRFAEYRESLPTLRASGGDCGGGSEGICVALDCRNLKANSVSATLQAKPGGGYSLNFQNPVIYNESGHGYWMPGFGCLRAEGENRPSRPCHVACVATAQANAEIMEDTAPTLMAGHERPIVAYDSVPPRRYIVRRLTPTECARLQGFPDHWGHPEHKDSMTPEEAVFWENIRKTDAELNGKTYRSSKNIDALLKWYNKLDTDSAEYTMWGNGIALPCAEFVLSGIVEELKNE